MPRATPPDRIAKLLAAAAATFVATGFHRTQMDDIAARLGVSKGTVYRSVDSKESLFAAVIAWGDRPHLVPVDGIPPTSDLSAVARSVAVDLSDGIASLALTAVVQGRRRELTNAQFGAEAERVAADLFDLMHRRRTAIMVVDRCAVELPDLAAMWFGDGRYALVDVWSAYLAARRRSLTVDCDPAILARTIVELITMWAVKMPWDPAPRPYDVDRAGRACSAIVRQLLAGPSIPGPDGPR